MSTVRAPHRSLDDLPTRGRESRRADLDRDLVAVLSMLAILALTALCFLARTALPA
ncbi:hypothetical protein [Nocardioides rubriscoriae]|uniref:hypothetical protein n=1 Tax=Nocardioides rubriscoriae TaxID=642762 RepID=UPI00147894D3|nr:hypothetical protein [Nocardioides rubriscoriae]